MDEYERLFKNRHKRNLIGLGTFGKVYSCKNNKAMKIASNISIKHEYNIIKKLHGFNVPEVYTFKSFSKRSNVMFFQHIQGETFHEWLCKNKSIKALRSIIFQVVYNLYLIHKKYPSFRHRDLHTSNIMIRPVKQKYITWKNIHISNECLEPVMIDFGMATMSTVKNPFNCKNCRDITTFDIHEKSEKIYDVHLFLCSLYNEVKIPKNINDRKVKHFILTLFSRNYIYDSIYVKYGRLRSKIKHKKLPEFKDVLESVNKNISEK